MSPDRSGLNSQSVKFRERESFPINRDFESNQGMERYVNGGHANNEIRVSENEVGGLYKGLGEL
jgi:hypothetical protein